MVTILAADKENRTSLILIALHPHPESEDYVLPLMLAETEKVRREHSRISAAGRGIILSSSAYNHYRTSKDRKKPLFNNRQIEGGHFHLTVINLFRLTSPFPRRPITPREEWMHFLNYADIYLLAEPTYSLPSFLAGSIAPVWSAYRQGCKKEQLYWRIEDYIKACLDENSRLDDAIKRARKAGKKEAGKFLRAELGALGLDKRALDTLISPFITQKDS